MPSLRVVSPVLVAFASLAFAVPAQAKTDTYTFRDTLQSTEGGAAGNTLMAVNNGTLDTNGQAVITATPAGTFVDTTIDAYACANTPTVRGYAFPAQGGLKSLNNAPVTATGSYTISMIVKFHPLRAGYSRLVDFSDSTADKGFYALNGSVNLYPSATFAENTFLDDRFSVITMTRDAATDIVTAYVGTTKVGEYIDTIPAGEPTKRYVAAGNLFFFMDNTTGSASVSESSPGIVTLIRVSDTPLAAADLPSIVDRACAAAACGNGVVEAGEVCDDGNNVDGDGCSSTCKVDSATVPDASIPAEAGVGVPTPDAGAVSFGDGGLSFDATPSSDDGSCSFVEGRRASSLPAMVVVGIGAVIAAVRRRRRA